MSYKLDLTAKRTELTVEEVIDATVDAIRDGKIEREGDIEAFLCTREQLLFWKKNNLVEHEPDPSKDDVLRTTLISRPLEVVEPEARDPLDDHRIMDSNTDCEIPGLLDLPKEPDGELDLGDGRTVCLSVWAPRLEAGERVMVRVEGSIGMPRGDGGTRGFTWEEANGKAELTTYPRKAIPLSDGRSLLVKTWAVTGEHRSNLFSDGRRRPRKRLSEYAVRAVMECYICAPSDWKAPKPVPMGEVTLKLEGLEETRRKFEQWAKEHRRYSATADIPLQNPTCDIGPNHEKGETCACPAPWNFGHRPDCPEKPNPQPKRSSP